MTEANKPPEDPTAPEASEASEVNAKLLLEEAEAEAAAAEAVAAAAKARAVAARLRREAVGLPDPAEIYDENEQDDEVNAYDQDYADEYDDEYADEYDEDYYESAEDYDESLAEQAGWRRWMPAIAAAVAVILVCTFIGLSAYMVLQHRDATKRQEREAAFVAGAKQGVLSMISLDFSKAKEDVQRVIDGSTGQFKDDFQHRANDFISVVTQSKAITEGTVNVAALESVNGGSAVVLVSATSLVTNSPPGKDVPPLVWRLRVTVSDVGGYYKMSKVEYVP
jgi:Mce-associated membrane protein